MSEREHPRAELAKFLGSGRLRQAVDGKLSDTATDLLIEAVGRYIERAEQRRPRRVRR